MKLGAWIYSRQLAATLANVILSDGDKEVYLGEQQELERLKKKYGHGNLGVTT